MYIIGEGVLGKPALILGVLAISALVALFWISGVLNPQPVSADTAKFYLDCPTTEVREGGSVDVFLVRVTNHQHNFTFGAYWHTDAGTAGTADYVHQNSGAVWGNYAEQRANRAKRTFRTREDSLVEGNETFTARFTPTGNVVNLNDPDRDNKCEITITDDDPNITEVEVTSSPARDDDTYGLGETIEISATFSTDVEVDGNPGLGLWVGSTWRGAYYLRGSGSDTLVFGYTVEADDSDSDGIRMGGGYQDGDDTWHNFLNHTAVTATGTETVAYQVYDGIADQSGHKVDGSLTPIGTGMAVASGPASGDTYRYGETIDIALTLSAPVDVKGEKLLNARVGTDYLKWRSLYYKSGTGTSTLVFGYTVETGDLDTDGISVQDSYVQNGTLFGWDGPGTVKVKGTDIVVPPDYTGLSDQSGHKLDGRPYPKTISITSTPAAATDTYGRDEIIQVSVNFGQNVTAGDGVLVLLRIGSVVTFGGAVYTSGNGSDTLIFEYTVLEDDSDDNGVDAYVPHGQDIKATGTEIAYQSNPGGETPEMGEDSNHKVDGSIVAADTVAPTISSIAITSDPGDDDTYVKGDAIEATVTFSEDVTVTGTPQLELEFDSTVKTADYAGTNGDEVVFSYTVALHDSDTDGISIGANQLSLNGGTIRDGSNNDAPLTHNLVATDSGHKVDGSDTTAPTVSSVAFTSDPGEDDTYGIGDAIEVTVTFSEDVRVTGTPQLELDFDGSAKTASYSSASGAAVVFSYIAVLGDSDTDGIAIGADKLTLNGGTIQDDADNNATLTHTAVAADSGHKVDASDTTEPTISSVSITSDPGSDYTYGTGDTIQGTVTFSEDVTVTGTPQLELNMYESTPSARQASYSSSDSSGADVVFTYTVAVGDSASDGLTIDANKLSLNGGTIKDAAGNDAVLTHSAHGPDNDHFVNGAGGL